MWKGQLDPALFGTLVLDQSSVPSDPPAPLGERHHAHLRSPPLTRRRFLGGAVGGAGAIVGTSVLGSSPAWATRRNAAPKPIPGGTTLNGTTFRFYAFGEDTEPTSITDFKGVVGVADVRGKGTATNPDGSTETLLYDTDLRFMQGAYVGTDGRVYEGTFGFV